MKTVLVLGLLMLLTTGLMAQNNSGFFSSRETGEEFQRRGDAGDEPGGGGGEPLPLGSGLLVLTGLAAGYALVKGKRNEEE